MQVNRMRAGGRVFILIMSLLIFLHFLARPTPSHEGSDDACQWSTTYLPTHAHNLKAASMMTLRHNDAAQKFGAGGGAET